MRIAEVRVDVGLTSMEIVEVSLRFTGEGPQDFERVKACVEALTDRPFEDVVNRGQLPYDKARRDIVIE